MNLAFGVVEKFISDRGFGFVTNELPGGKRESYFFHIRSVRKARPDLIAGLESGNGTWFWYSLEESPKGKQAVPLDQRQWNARKQDAECMVEQIEQIWAHAGALPSWLDQVTSELLGTDRATHLAQERTLREAARKRIAEEQRKLQEAELLARVAKIEADRASRLAENVGERSQEVDDDISFGPNPCNRKPRRRTRGPYSSTDFGSDFSSKPASPEPHGESCDFDSSKLAYVTRATFKHLAGRNIEASACPPLEIVFSAIFHRSLAELMNVPEARRLYALKLMTEHQFSMVRVTKSYFSRQYVFKVASPKFHGYENCEYLKSDFVNYRVPPEIEKLGDEKVQQFQKFCEDNKALLQEDDPAKFWRHVGAHFRAHIFSASKVHYANSGIQELRQLSVEQLETWIENQLDEAIAILEDGIAGAEVRKVRFAPDKKKASASLNNPRIIASVERWFDLKLKVIDALMELYLKQAGATDFLLPEAILRQAGLEPCKGCQISPLVGITWL